MADVPTDESVDATPEPDEAREALLGRLTEALGDKVLETHLAPGQDLWIRVAREHWQDAGRALKTVGCTYFGFLSAIDWLDAPEGRYEDTEFDGGLVDEDGDGEEASTSQPETVRVCGGSTRFQVLARAQIPHTALGVTVKADVPDDELSVETWVDIYPGANWHERELYEMFGIDVHGHPGLKHIYLPSEFEGHPLRKDYALLARVVKPWPGVVDIEEIPPHLEDELERQVMAEFEGSEG